MPAAAVIPAPIAYINVAAVKKLVVGFRDGTNGLPSGVYRLVCSFIWGIFLLFIEWLRDSGRLL